MRSQQSTASTRWWSAAPTSRWPWRGDLDAGATRVRAGIAEVQDAAAAAGIASGIAGPDDADVLQELAGGRSTLLVCSADVRIYARAIDEVAARLRAPAREASGVGA